MNKSTNESKVESIETNKVTVRANTQEEEFDRIMYTLSRMEFYKKYGYDKWLSIPNLQVFKQVIDNPDKFNEIDRTKAFKLFKESNIYLKTNYEADIEEIKADFSRIYKAIRVLKNISKNYPVKIFDNYQIVLTAFGTGGSYNERAGLIIIRITGDNKRDHIDTIIHEIIHIAIEESLIQKYAIQQREKEAIVDGISFLYLQDLFKDYSPQTFGDKNLYNLIIEEKGSTINVLIDKILGYLETNKI